jgi:hypothetical protein
METSPLMIQVEMTGLTITKINKIEGKDKAEQEEQVIIKSLSRLNLSNNTYPAKIIKEISYLAIIIYQLIYFKSKKK